MNAIAEASKTKPKQTQSNPISKRAPMPRSFDYARDRCGRDDKPPARVRVLNIFEPVVVNLERSRGCS